MPTLKTKSLTPFLFSSDKELQSNKNRWYVMWINPSSIEMSFSANRVMETTKAGYIFLNWKNKPVELTFTGVSGWVRTQTTLEQIGNQISKGNKSATESIAQTKQNEDKSLSFSFGKAFIDAASQVSTSFNKGFLTPIQQLSSGGNIDFFDTLESIAKLGEDENTVTENNPRLFFDRLRRVALQDKYYGYRTKDPLTNRDVIFTRYNQRKLLIYTKRYPQGTMISGFFTDFSVPEDAQNSEMITYSARFVVESGLDPDNDTAQTAVPQGNKVSIADISKVANITRNFIDPKADKEKVNIQVTKENKTVEVVKSRAAIIQGSQSKS